MFDPTSLEERITGEKRGVIPVLRDRLLELSENGAAIYRSELRYIANRMRRAEPVRKVGEGYRASVRRGLGDQIRAYAAAHPDHDQQTIGEVFNVSAGRVSEYLSGKAWQKGPHVAGA